MKIQKERKGRAVTGIAVLATTLAVTVIWFGIVGLVDAITIKPIQEPVTHARQVIEKVMTEDPGATIVEKTDSSIKFRLSNGNFRLVTTIGTFYTQDGFEIDPTLEQIESKDGWVARTGEGLDYRLEFKDDSTRHYYPRRDVTDEYVELGAPQYYDGQNWQTLPLGEVKVERNRLFFEETDYTLEHLVLPDGAKFNLILNNSSFNKPIRWPISFNNLTKVDESLFSNNDDKEVARFEKPIWYDSGDKSGDIEYTIENNYIIYSNPDLTGAIYPVTIDPTYGPVGIAAGGDDYYHVGNDFWGDLNQLIVGESVVSGNTFHTALRFDGVTIPNGSTINSASINFRTLVGQGKGTVLTKISAVDEDDPVAATTDAECDTDDGIRTTAQVDWDFTVVTSENQLLTTANFASVSQELVDRVGWASGQAMVFHIADDGNLNRTQLFASYENTSYTEPTLTIEYTDTTAPTVNTLSPTDNATGVSTNTNLVITFSEAVDVETGNITIKKTSDNTTFETIGVTSGNVTGTGTAIITVNPTGTLAEQTEYYVLIDATAFDDTSSNSYAGISSTTAWSFTTVAGVANNYLESVTIDSGNDDGFIINSIYWEGDKPTGATIGFQLAVATSTNFTGVSFIGSDGTVSTEYSVVDTDDDGMESVPVFSNYHNPLQSGYRYFRYRVYLDKTASSPVVSKVVINWSR